MTFTRAQIEAAIAAIVFVTYRPDRQNLEQLAIGQLRELAALAQRNTDAR